MQRQTTILKKRMILDSIALLHDCLNQSLKYIFVLNVLLGVGGKPVLSLRKAKLKIQA